MADQNLTADARSFDIDISFPKLYDLVSNETTPDVVMARTNAASPVVVSYVSTSVTKEGCGKAQIGEGVNKPNDRVDSSSVSTDNMGLANVEKCVLLLVRMVVPQRMGVNRVFCNNLVMVVPNLEGNRYTKETIRVEYEWKPPHYCTCLIFSHLLNNCPKAPKRVVNKMDKGKGGSSGADSEAASQKTTPSVGKKNVSISGDGTFSLINSVEQSFTPLVEKINMFQKQLLEGECVLVDDDASKPSGVGYGTKSLLEQWRETYVNDDYDPYDDDMYEGQNIPDNIQSICDNLDIK
ncbi:hypothetical protein Tco_1398259, partial [Tanacetum coccineum]